MHCDAQLRTKRSIGVFVLFCAGRYRASWRRWRRPATIGRPLLPSGAAAWSSSRCGDIPIRKCYVASTAALSFCRIMKAAAAAKPQLACRWLQTAKDRHATESACIKQVVSGSERSTQFSMLSGPVGARHGPGGDAAGAAGQGPRLCAAGPGRVFHCHDPYTGHTHERTTESRAARALGVHQQQPHSAHAQASAACMQTHVRGSEHHARRGVDVFHY